MRPASFVACRWASAGRLPVHGPHGVFDQNECRPNCGNEHYHRLAISGEVHLEAIRADHVGEKSDQSRIGGADHHRTM